MQDIVGNLPNCAPYANPARRACADGYHDCNNDIGRGPAVNTVDREALSSALRGLASAAAALQADLDIARKGPLLQAALVQPIISRANENKRAVVVAAPGAIASPSPSVAAFDKSSDGKTAVATAADLQTIDVSTTHHSNPDAAPERMRILVYHGGVRGQGIGNSLNGLWVAHLLARRHNRTVCVEWRSFQIGFVRVDKQLNDACSAVLLALEGELSALGPVVEEGGVGGLYL
jgi:hypothetical protein